MMDWFKKTPANESPNTTTILVEGMSCDGCVRKLTKRLSALPGVTNVEVSLEPRGHALVTGEISEEALRAEVTRAGYVPVSE